MRIAGSNETVTTVAPPVRPPRDKPQSNRLRLQTLVRLRWLAVAGQTTALLVVSLFLAPRRGLLWAAVRRARNRRRVRAENLLKDLWRLGESDGRFDAPRAVSDVLAVRLAPRRAIDEARAAGLVRVDGPMVRLTPQGLRRAAEVVRNHRIWELYLSRRLDLADDHLHRDAEEMEHALDSSVLEEIDEALGRPSHDPHGRPIPRGTPA